jgi:hypothetical protein
MGRQWMMHPAQANFVDFHPALTDGRLAAFFERLAAALRIQQGELANGGFACKQGPEKMHGDRPPEIEVKHACPG